MPLKKYLKKKDIPSSYAKILGETNFQSWEIPRFVRQHVWRTQARLDQHVLLLVVMPRDCYISYLLKVKQ